MSRRIAGEGTIRQRTDGRWEGRVRLPDGRRKSVFGTTAEEANDKRLVVLETLRKGLPVASEKITVAAFLEQWLARHRGEVRASTAACYDSAIANHITPHVGRLRLARLQPRDISNMMTILAEAGLAPRTIQLARSILRMALKQAVDWGELPRNPCDAVRGPRQDRKPVNPWDVDEARTFLQGVEDDRLHALYVLALTVGLRQGELVGLRWQDLDLDAGELRVAQARDRRTGTFGPPKSQTSRRVLALPTMTVEALEEHRDRQQEEQEIMGKGWNAQDLVFVTSNGTPYDGSNVGAYFRRHVARLGLRAVRFHDLRHSCASMLLASGVSLREIMETLGHSQIALTANTYTHIAPAMRRNVAVKMDAAFASRKPRGGQVGGQLQIVGRT